ncbi:GT4 family glycosyltransferase PelF [Thermocrinis sp.]
MGIKILDKGKNVDVLFILEGTYPYVKGGVSTWVHQIITGMKDINFGVLFLGSRPEDYKGIGYQLPENLVYLETVYMFSEESNIESKRKTQASDKIKLLRVFLEDKDFESSWQNITSFEFFREITYEDFLYSKQSWDFIEEIYEDLGIDVPFVDYYWTMRNLFAPIFVVARLGMFIEKKEIGLIHSPSTGYAGFLGSLMSREYGIPFIITEHGIYTKERKIDILNARWVGVQYKYLQKKYDMDDLKKLWIKMFVNLGRVSYYQAKKVFSLFEEARKQQISLGCPQEKTKVIPNGVDVERLSRLIEIRPEGVPKIVSLIGRVVAIKDVKTFIKAMALLSKKLDGVEGWIVGPEDEEPEYAQECKELAKILGVEDRVKFLGFRNIADVLPQTGVFTLTSISEGMPMTVLEAMASGVPCVCTDVGSCRQLIYGGLNEEDMQIGQAGIITPVGDAQALAESYHKLLTDEEFWKKCQRAGLERVRKFYRFDQFIDNYRSVYEEYLEG